jgi:DNA invertase Pin-like site-specific DNA recombinase/predicted DNA-binding transcriptional regulator AlpA
MISSDLIQAHHRSRKAVIYIRQSTAHQVLTNTESQRMQRAMKDHVLRLGWPSERIEVVEADTGVTATTTVGRDAYKNLLSEVALGHVGIVLSYESARLSRNCSDWYPLLDVCAMKTCLIGDRDGIYEPWTPNGRLLLGMKGILSELEIHTIRGRLLAGVQSKARRGELALALPAGLLRRDDGVVVKDPNLQVQQAIDLVFHTFLELKSAAKVVRHFNEHAVRIPKRHRNDEIIWRLPTLAAVIGVLRNPAYAGAFVYGKTRTVRKFDGQGSSRPQQKRREMNEWSVIVKDRYPAYVSWEIFERIQSALSDNYAEYDRNKTRGVPREGDALLHGLMYCGECGHKMVVQYKGSPRYLCNHLRQQRQLPVCQYLPAVPIDEHVVKAFFDALSPAELDLYDQAMSARKDQFSEIDAAHARELQRLRYEAHLARRQYDRVDPDNRLVASELERRWEAALRAMRDAEEKFESARKERDKVVPLHVPRELRAAFSSLGKSLPGLWQQGSLRRAQKKALLRCLIDKVVAHRKTRDSLAARIVWRGGAVSEIDIPITVGSLHELSGFEDMEKQILDFEREGKSDEEIARLLTERGHRSPLHDAVLPSTVKTIRLRHKRFHRFRGPRPRHVDGFLTLPQVAERLQVTPHWLYHLINRGVVEIDRDDSTGLYLFPDHPKTLDELRQLKAGALKRVCYRRRHQDA